MAADRIVIVGASLAGVRAAETLRKDGHDGPIILVGAEPHLPYDRPPLSKGVLAGKVTPESASLPIDPALEVELCLSTRATALDLRRRVVDLDGEAEPLGFDQLVIATGAHPRTLAALPELDGVFVLRTIDDCLALRSALTAGPAPRVAVVGAGFIGSEVAATCQGLGLAVTVIEALPVPMVRAVGEEVGRRCARLHLDHGVKLRLGVGVAGLAGTGRVEAVRLADGSVVPADVVVIGVGVVPSTGWLESSGVDLGDGVLCDRWCRVRSGGLPVPGVVAAGDVARWDHPLFGESIRVEHWTNAADQGHAAALTLLCGEEAPPYSPVPYFWSDQYQTKIQFVGRNGADVQVVEGSIDDDRFVVAYGAAGRLVGALGFSRPARIMAYKAMIARGGPFPAQV